MPHAGDFPRDAVHPIASLDPAAPFDDLEPLAKLIPDDVRVVAIGESTHGASEFYRLRHRLARFLVERLGFTALVWESGFPESFRVDDWIQGGPGDRDAVLATGMTMNMGRCDEMGELVEWLRRENAARANRPDARPIRFYGLDLPGTSGSLGPALDLVAPYVERVDPGFAARLNRLRELAASFGRAAPATDAGGEPTKLVLEGTTALHQYTSLAPADRNELTALLVDLSSRFDALRRTYAERSDEAAFDLARQHLRAAAKLDAQLRCVAAYLAGDAAACEANVRDEWMADAVEWTLAREPRVVLLAHNGHIQKTPISTTPGVTPVDTVGGHLARRLGRAYLAIGTTVGSGDVIVTKNVEHDGRPVTELALSTLPPAGADVLDRLLAGRFAEPTLVDLRTLDAPSLAAVKAASKMRVIHFFVETDAVAAFDALVHVPRISLWTSRHNATMSDDRATNVAAT